MIEYSDLNVWKEAKNLGILVYINTDSFPDRENYGLTSQLRRAAVSILSNVAESCRREHIKDTLQVLYIARGSMYEVEAQIYLALDLGYITTEQLNAIADQILKLKKILFGFIAYHKRKLSS